VAIETAQILKQLNLQPERTIRVVAWMAEEIGIFGGKAYAKQHAAEMGNHFAAIETDLGAGHPLGINVCCDGASLKILQPIANVLETSGAGVLRSSEETGADIIPLKVAGVPTFSPIQDLRKYFDYHHTAADTLDKIDVTFHFLPPLNSPPPWGEFPMNFRQWVVSRQPSNRRDSHSRSCVVGAIRQMADGCPRAATRAAPTNSPL